MRTTYIVVAALSAILLNSVLASASQAQSAPYGANSGTIPVQNAPLYKVAAVSLRPLGGTTRTRRNRPLLLHPNRPTNHRVINPAKPTWRRRAMHRSD